MFCLQNVRSHYEQENINYSQKFQKESLTAEKNLSLTENKFKNSLTTEKNQILTEKNTSITLKNYRKKSLETEKKYQIKPQMN